MEHPCRGVCSGWAQGYETGKQQTVEDSFKQAIEAIHVETVIDTSSPEEELLDPIVWDSAAQGVMCCTAHACKLRIAGALKRAYELGLSER